jgi:hypothetical protein
MLGSAGCDAGLPGGRPLYLPELAGRGPETAPTRSTAHRVLLGKGLVLTQDADLVLAGMGASFAGFVGAKRYVRMV